MPSSCILFAAPAISDGDISYSCEFDSPRKLSRIDLLKASECKSLKNQKFNGRIVQLVENEDNFEYKNRTYIAQKVVFENKKVFYVRTVKDDEDCIIVMSSNKSEVEQILEPLWSEPTQAGKVKGKK